REGSVRGRVEAYRKPVMASRHQAVMGQVKRKEANQNRQNVKIDWIINSPNPTPIGFFRLTHPTARYRAIDTYKKCFSLALSRKTIQRDWEIWLKEKKAILACREAHDTNLQIQQDFIFTMKTITGTTESNTEEHNTFASGSHRIENVNDQEVYTGVTKDSPNNPFIVPAKDNDASGEGNDAPSEDDAPNASSSSYHPESSESDDSVESEQKEKPEFQYEWFVGPGIKESKLNENENKWTVGIIDVSNLLLEYRNISIKKASEQKIENAVEMLSLNHIFLLDENLSTGISEMIGPASLKAIFENIRSEYTSYHLSDKDIIRCCKSLLRKWQKEVDENDNDLVLEVFESIFKYFPCNTNRADAREDSFIHEVFAPIILPFFVNSDLICEWSSDVLDSSTHRKRKFDPILQGRKADFSAYAQTKGNRYYLLVSEIKSARYISSKKINFVDCDLVKIGNEMKDMLDKCIEDGVKTKDLAICSILVEAIEELMQIKV
ncbi:10845_t:CDS:10, partial [Cetraspora pellucida]